MTPHTRIPDAARPAHCLSAVVRRHYSGERVVVLANRGPLTLAPNADGTSTLRRSPGGVVTALEPVVRACDGVWISQGAAADRMEANRWVRPRLGYRVRTVPTSDQERRGHYDGVSNEALWALCHRTSVDPVCRPDDFDAYRAVNERFAAAACEEADSPSPLILVQDYHCALAPREIRAQRPDATVVTFWHVPWPDAERFNSCPWADELLDGLLGSTIVGFQTPDDCRHFLDAAASRPGIRVDRRTRTVLANGRRTAVRDYPISIAWPPRGLAEAPDVATARVGVRRELGRPDGARLIVGVDRLDYSKGIEEKLLAFERLCELRDDVRAEGVLLQILEPSRETLPPYRDLRRRVQRAATRINSRFGRPGRDVVVLVERHHEPREVFRYLRAADVCHVGSLHDGMNLVAKEFVAARDDERGVLVLSRFTGAARELREAVIVDPRDIDATALALAAALDMPEGERIERLRAMRTHVRDANVYKWAASLLRDAADLREPSSRARPADAVQLSA